MAVRTYGNIELVKNSKDKNFWKITEAEPHVCIRLKHNFPKIGQTTPLPYLISDQPDNCHDLLWFMDRYPLKINDSDLRKLKNGRKKFIGNINDIERILIPNYVPRETIGLREGQEARHYQLTARDIFLQLKRVLCADDIGLGKTITAILGALEKGLTPAAVVVQSHLGIQWVKEIAKFTDLRVHVIKTRDKIYSLPPADIYVFKYSNIAGWVDIFSTGIFKYVIFDETQELRIPTSNKYEAAEVLSQNAKYVMGLTATPIYNYGNEIYWVMNIIKPGSLGTYTEFSREWMIDDKKVGDPDALGAYLRETRAMIRRTRSEVKMELPEINKIVHYIDYDVHEVQKAEKQAIDLAISVLTGSSFMERGEAAREFNALLRLATGVGKARPVAEYVKMLLQDGMSIILGGWHRQVYDIWNERLAEFKPVMITGSESSGQKERSKQQFINRESRIMLMSLRSGAGIDGLQGVCDTNVFGELDWSPEVHKQFTGRIDRPGQKNPPVTSIYLVTEYGSDPVIIEKLGVKASQSHGIMNPMEGPGQQHTDDTRIRELAKAFLKSKNVAYAEAE